jgi:hypothetical protein
VIFVVDEVQFNQIEAGTNWQISMTGMYADVGEVGVYTSSPRSATLFAKPVDAVTAIVIV